MVDERVDCRILVSDADLHNELVKYLKDAGVRPEVQKRGHPLWGQRGVPAAAEIVVSLTFIGTFTAVWMIVTEIVRRRDSSREVKVKIGQRSIKVKAHTRKEEEKLLKDFYDQTIYFLKSSAGEDLISNPQSETIDANAALAKLELRTPNFEEWVGAQKATLAIVFTDVVGSTALGNDLGNKEMNEVRRAHFIKGKEIVKHYDGCIIKTIGDSLMVAFRTAADALEFALTFCRETGHPQVEIRAGIHVGPVDIEDEDAFGAMVNYTARVEQRANGSEIWVSSEANGHIKQYGADHLKRLRWTAHTNCILKGFQGRHTVWSVNIP